MPAVPVDTSLTGYTSGSVDRQDDIYRNRQRPQLHQLGSSDSGYDSATHLRFGSLRASSSSSLLGLADSVKCNELLNNGSNFALKTVVECYQSDFRSISVYCDAPAAPGLMSKVLKKLTWRQSARNWMREVFMSVSQYVLRSRPLPNQLLG